MKFLSAFAMGGFLCVIGQILIDKTKLTPAKILVIYVVTGAAMQAIGFYKHLKELFGCGAILPLTGFGSALADGVKQEIDAIGFLGIFTGGLKATAGGIVVAILSALAVSIFFKAKDKS